MAFAQFRMHPVQNPVESANAGRPIFESKEWVRIHTPGDKTNIIDREVTPKDRADYPREYAAFKEGKDQDEAAGTPLSAWGGVSPSRIEELAWFKVKTVEHLAAVIDASLSGMGPQTREERQKAKLYLEAAAGKAPTTKLAAEMAEMRKELDGMRSLLKAREEELALERATKPKA